ncbi:GFA family protein [Phenylobacterium sp.]|uniref:GFA family protein n=1 Tax=Phenylobacterium sp. TaxID=1871053 RepID=UPI002CC6260F|nr:GFA family protein [Phenylobacterium sp.]HVI32962.1 GFA family protein [Phenylobacterium sp.]
MDTQTHRGGCLCGAVRFEIAGPAKWTGYCHCHSCRKHTGAPASAFAGFERSQVTVTAGELALFASSPGVRRGFCAACGSTRSYEGDRWPTEFHVHVGAFDDPEPFAPTGHAFAEERVSWLHLTDPAPP